MKQKKYCPVCDRPVSGRFCKNCRQFVKPYERNADIYVNESHGSDETHCEYHLGLDPKPQMNVSQPRRQYSEKNQNAFGKRKLVTGLKIAVIIYVILITIRFLTIFLPVFLLQNDSSDDDGDAALLEHESETYDMEYPFYDDGYLEDDEYESLLAENGYDSNGYKEADYDEIMAAGEGCSGYLHFDMTSRTALRHITDAIEDAGIDVSEYKSADYTDNYYCMDRYGEVYSYFNSYTFAIFENEEYEEGYDGYICLDCDTVTDELMEVTISVADYSKFTDSFIAVVGELDEDAQDEAEQNFDSDLSSMDDEYGYFNYGDIWVYVHVSSDDVDDYYKYYAVIQMSFESEYTSDEEI